MARKIRDRDSSYELEDERDGHRREKPVQRNAANARERARMRVLSKAFSRLKTSLPWVPADTKLSKLDTLRLAASYIGHLRQILTEDSTSQTALHPISLTWPFTFHQRIHHQGDLSHASSQISLTDARCELSAGFREAESPDFRDYSPPPCCEYLSPGLTDSSQHPGDLMNHFL